MEIVEITLEQSLLAIMVIISVLIIIVVVLQPSQKTGLMGDATDIEKRDKRGAELFLYRFTIILTIFFIAVAIAYGMGINGVI